MKRKFTALLCSLLVLLGVFSPASALEGEALRAADTLAALGLVDPAGAAVDYNLTGPATRAPGGPAAGAALRRRGGRAG